MLNQYASPMEINGFCSDWKTVNYIWFICFFHNNLPIPSASFYQQNDKQFSRIHVLFLTLPETNIAPENRPLEEEIPIGNHHI